MEKFDRVYIGTGPISVADAVHQSHQQAKILLIDEKQQVGGAWVAIPVGSYGELEIGCHIWSYNQKVYDFLASFYDLRLIDLQPQPYFLRGDTRISYDQKHALTTLKSVGRYFKKGKFAQAFQYLRSDPSARFPIISKKYRYPKGGARDLQRSVEQKIKVFNLSTRLGTSVEGLKWEDDAWSLILTEGSTIRSNDVVLTATSSIQSIRTANETIALEHKPLNYTHFHLVVKGKPKKPCSYVRVLNHSIIHRVSEITYQLEGVEDEPITVYLIGVFDSALPKNQSNEAVANDLHRYLIERGFIRLENTLLYQQVNRFETTYIERSQRNRVNALPHLELLATTDLIYGFHHKLDDWLKV